MALDEVGEEEDDGLGPDATSAALLLICPPRARRRSKRVEGRPVACQLVALGPAGPSPERKLFVDKVPRPKRLTRRAEEILLRLRRDRGGLKRFFCEFEAGPLSADYATGLFRGYAIFLYKSPEGLMQALEEPRKLFDGCELQCRRAHRQAKKKRATAAPADAGGQRNVASFPSEGDLINCCHTAAFAFVKGD